ncbi:MAG: transposase [Deferribacteres bacterium]|nr:transposase [Deferribacteres bacterium]
MSKKSHRKFTAAEKYQILQEGESGSLTISEACRRHGISAVTYYSWRDKARQAALEGLQNNHRGRKSNKSRHELELEEENKRLKHTIVELSQENVSLKKKNLG